MWFPLLLIGAFFFARAATKPRVGQPVLAAGVPSPLMVLDGFARARQQPPPQVILCALAEAEALQRNDLAHAIVRTYIAPIVHRYELAHAVDANPGVPAPAQDQVPMTASPGAMMTTMSDEEIEAAMNADPATFIRTGRATQPPPPPASVMSPVMPPPMTMGTRPPIEGVGELDWRAFCDKLARETPLFATQRHVGQYRARNERLMEIGIDPRTIIGKPDAQRAALDREMADAWRQANASGLVKDHCNRLIRLPANGEAVVSRSGILGVIQAAGLEGGLSWLENAKDRERFPHTTEVFLRTNGVF